MVLCPFVGKNIVESNVHNAFKITFKVSDFICDCLPEYEVLFLAVNESHQISMYGSNISAVKNKLQQRSKYKLFQVSVAITFSDWSDKIYYTQ